jgi:septal ring factor EnvC (AmiA/AmiB activator)
MAAVFPLLIAAFLLLAPAMPFAQDADLTQIKERELEQVRDKISALKASMDRRAAERDRLATDLQNSEVDIAEKRATVKDLERQRDYSRRRKAEIEVQLEKREAELRAESDQLAAQVSAAYTSGNQERLKLLLNQDDPATLGRLMTYYRYLSDHRGDNIVAVNNHIAELATLRAEAAAEAARLESLAASRQAELAQLDGAQQDRQALLASLKARLAEEGSEVERLAAEEKDLARLIAELTSILSDYPITSEEPFSAYRGRLTWPVAGSLIHDFGQPRAGGGVKWNGVVLAAPRGRDVRSIYHGRVVFADWLSGMGLLVIVDHGEGYLSLYGYNETTLKSAGDWVAPGDVIATVGDSGGRPQTGLYFEVRQGTRPLNPRQWVSRQPGRN